ncbi:MAG TPA: A/G-specific adenine glycosylase [Thermoanaerobaculia bacterium]|nr:A/G-specific adenine glycosylase [Thermoanaerobaculia bacterium]
MRSPSREPDFGSARRSLYAWYDATKRDLPWRRTNDPYAVLVSELMLQQTRVEVVVPYFEAFLAVYPSVERLAAASEDEVLARWSGLGYYRRARFLHRAARELVAAGVWPRTTCGLRALPGIGEYTAAAVASIAFGEMAPALDGNVERVLCRRLALAGDPKRSATRARLREAARELLDPTRPGDGNQALMELGATVCRPRSPGCERCPLTRGCAARAQGRPESFPQPRARRRRVAVRWHLAVVRDGERVLLARRPSAAAVLPGLWSLPAFEPESAQPEAVAAEIEAALAHRWGGRWRLVGLPARARHAITHRDLELLVHTAQWEPDRVVAEGGELGWFDARERRSLPRTAIVEKALVALAGAAAPRLTAPRGRRPPRDRRRG